MAHKGSCQCGAAWIEFTKDPDFVLACNCIACQRRTGTAYSVNAYFEKADLRTQGIFKQWDRVAESGRRLSYFFCPDCGTNVYWSLEMRPEHLGVAVGCLHTAVGEPDRVIWMQEKLDWVSFPEHWPSYQKSTV